MQQINKTQIEKIQINFNIKILDVKYHNHFNKNTKFKVNYKNPKNKNILTGFLNMNCDTKIITHFIRDQLHDDLFKPPIYQNNYRKKRSSGYANPKNNR